MSQDNSNGFLDVFVNWLKERIQSPFVVAFFCSWLVINREFVFLFIFYEGADKHVLLSGWNFAKQSDFFGYEITGNSYYRSFILPSSYAFIFSVIINPISLMTAAARYWLSAFSKGIAESAKKYHDYRKPWCRIKGAIHNLKKEQEALKLENNKWSYKNNKLKSEYEKESEVFFGYKKSLIYKFIVNSLKANSLKINEEKSLQESDVFGTDSAEIDFTINGVSKNMNSAEFMEWLLESDLELAYSVAIDAIKIKKGISHHNKQELKINFIKNIKKNSVI
jgi:hypothetical protein